MDVLRYRITRKEQFVTSFHVFEESLIGEPLVCNQIKGYVKILFFDQAKSRNYHEGISLSKQYSVFYKGVNTIKTLSLKGADWQILFYSKGLVLEDYNQMVYVPYEDITAIETCIAQIDKNKLYHIKRHQVELLFNKLEKKTSMYLIFQKKEDSINLCKIISPQTARIKVEQKYNDCFR